MRYNLSRHSLLKKLAEKFNSVDNEGPKILASLVGLKLSEIDDHLKRDKAQRELILSGLGNAKEIEAFYDHEDKVAGYFITDNIGLNSVVENKYLNKNHDIILNWLKNIMQLLIPIASLAVAILALSLKSNPTEKILIQKVDSLSSKLIEMQKKISELEINYNNNNTKTKVQP